jgi:hypothetical protein
MRTAAKQAGVGKNRAASMIDELRVEITGRGVA